MADDPHHHSRRDAETFIVLGIFMGVLAIAVLAGTFFALTSHAMIVNAAAGAAMLAVGIGFWWRGIQVKKTLPR